MNPLLRETTLEAATLITLPRPGEETPLRSPCLPHRQVSHTLSDTAGQLPKVGKNRESGRAAAHFPTFGSYAAR